MWLLFFILLCGNVYAQTAVTITQYGYITDNNGHIVGKYSNDINNGKVITLPAGYTYTQVPDQNTLNNIQIWVNPTVTAQAQLTALRQTTLNAMADAQIASNPTTQTTASSLKSQGAQ